VTTRPRRPTESDLAYEFVDEQEFLARVSAGYFLEWASYHGHLYGTPVPQAHEGVTLFEIELQGAHSLLKIDPTAFVVALEPARIEDLEERMRSRGDREEQIAIRLEDAQSEIAEGRKIAGLVVVNEVLENTVAEIVRALEDRMAADSID